MKAPLVITLVIVAAASLAGWHNQRELARATRALEEARQQARAAGLNAEPSGNAPLRTRSRQISKTDAATLAKDLILFARELDTDPDVSDPAPLDDREQRISEWQRGLLALQPEEMNLLIAELRNAPGVEENSRQELLFLVFQSFGESHPHDALGAIASSPDLLVNIQARTSTISSALIRGMEKDPAASTEWFKNHRDLLPGELEGRVLERVISSTSLFNPEAAFKLISDLGTLDPEFAVGMITNSARTHEQRDATLAAFRDYLTTVEDPKLREKLHAEGNSAMFSASLLDGVDNLTAWAGNGKFTPEEIGDWAGQTLPYFREGDEQKWMDWLLANVPDEKTSTHTVPQVFTQWAALDYQAAGEWLAHAQDGPMKEKATANYVSLMADQHPATAARWFQTLPPGQDRDGLGKHLYGLWSRKDPAAAATFAEQNGIPK